MHIASEHGTLKNGACFDEGVVIALTPGTPTCHFTAKKDFREIAKALELSDDPQGTRTPKRLGHSTIGMTIAVCSHLLPGMPVHLSIVAKLSGDARKTPTLSFF